MKGLAQIAADEAKLAASRVPAETLWLWRAVALDGRICDFGVVRAADEGRADAIARMCIGGPWRREVERVLLENLAEHYPTAHANTSRTAEGGK